MKLKLKQRRFLAALTAMVTGGLMTMSLHAMPVEASAVQDSIKDAPQQATGIAFITRSGARPRTNFVPA